MIRIVYFLICSSVLLISCEKNISIKLKPTSTNLVVDASIEQGNYPVVYLSRSFNYFNKISADVLLQSEVHSAHIEISNGLETDTLQEFTIYTDNNSGLALTYYSFNRDDSSGKFVGELQQHYTISITVDGKTYTGSTGIPALRKTLDSVWWEPAPKSVDSSKVVVRARITDPPGLGDYTRYYTSVNSGSFYPGQQSVFDDAITDGTTYDVTLDKGVDRNLSVSNNDENFFSHGDTVTVKLANIDKATYDFWRTMEYNYQSIGNPFSSPVTVLSNLSGGALGYFGGYAAQYQSITIPQ